MAHHARVVVGPDPRLDRSSQRTGYYLVGPASYSQSRTDWQDERTNDFVVFEREGRFVVDGKSNYSGNDLKKEKKQSVILKLKEFRFSLFSVLIIRTKKRLRRKDFVNNKKIEFASCFLIVNKLQSQSLSITMLFNL